MLCVVVRYKLLCKALSAMLSKVVAAEVVEFVLATGRVCTEILTHGKFCQLFENIEILFF